MCNLNIIIITKKIYIHIYILLTSIDLQENSAGHMAVNSSA